MMLCVDEIVTGTRLRDLRAELHAAFEGLLTNPRDFEWRASNCSGERNRSDVNQTQREPESRFATHPANNSSTNSSNTAVEPNPARTSRAKHIMIKTFFSFLAARATSQSRELFEAQASDKPTMEYSGE
jgi:hypothetical protein